MRQLQLPQQHAARFGAVRARQFCYCCNHGLRYCVNTIRGIFYGTLFEIAIEKGELTITTGGSELFHLLFPLLTWPCEVLSRVGDEDVGRLTTIRVLRYPVLWSHASP